MAPTAHKRVPPEEPDPFVTCVRAWENEYAEEHGEDALTFQGRMSRIERGGASWVNDDGELETGLATTPRPTSRSLLGELILDR